MRSGRVVIDHAIVPMRDLFAAAESRRDVSSRSNLDVPRDQVAGGLWNTTRPEEQEAVLTQQLYKLFMVLAEHDIPVTLLHFPRLATDADYLYERLGFLLADIPSEAFLRVFNGVSKLDLIHDFSVKVKGIPRIAP